MDRDAVLRERLTEKAHELFSAYGVTIGEAPVPPHDGELCAVLGFTGDTLRGCVVTVATIAALVVSNPVPGGASSAWIAELTNQLVGRFKNDLLRRGIEITLSIPVVLTAKRIVAASDQGIGPIHLGVGNGTLTLWLEVDGDAALATELAPEPPAVEGDLVLF
jgi:CheY-specific phosphatase CheX